MFISAILSLALAICICLAVVYKMFKVLGLDPMQTLLWLGLAAVPAPPTRRRSTATLI